MKMPSIKEKVTLSASGREDASRQCDNPLRRKILLYLAVVIGSLFVRPFAYCRTYVAGSVKSGINNKQTPVVDIVKRESETGNRRNVNLGTGRDGLSDVFVARGGTPETNIRQILEKLGGIGAIIGKEDIVILKPNAQWWNQGTTNTDAMKAFIEAILGIPGFRGELIIAENHQCANPDSRGWNTTLRNGRFNLNELVAYFNGKGFKNVTKYHWRCAGPNPRPFQGDESSGSKIVKGPWDGDGYVWNRDLLYTSPLGRKCILSYPIFTSLYSGVTIDFRNGAWKNGRYTGQPVKFINFSALNHHGDFSGVTASVKNYMGIVDMTCGFQGTSPPGFWNTHFIGIRGVQLSQYLPRRIKIKISKLYTKKYSHHTGGVLGSFMREIRFADLNIITAHWVGYESRTGIDGSGHPRMILAGTDPVALDYVAGREIMTPLTREKAPNNKWLNSMNDVTDREGPFYKFLDACHREGIGNIERERIRII